MPIRTATVNRQLEKNGERLHRAMMARIQTHGADHEPSEEERALMAEREQLKQERTRRHDESEHPRPKAEKLVRTHHAVAKEHAPKAKKEKEAKPAAKGHKPTRAEKQASKAAALAAAKQKARAAGKPGAKEK